MNYFANFIRHSSLFGAAWIAIALSCAASSLVYAAPPSSSIDAVPDLPPTSDLELSGAASGSTGDIQEVRLTFVDEDSSYYWNGVAFQSVEVQVLAALSGVGSNVTWSYEFPDPLPAGEYTVYTSAVDSNGEEQTLEAQDTFAISNYFTSSGNGTWGPIIQTPSIPVAAANLPDGKILHWAAYRADTWLPKEDFGQTVTTIFDPITGQSTERLVQETTHDMFCMGANILEDGRVFINGGSSAARTSIFDGINGTWAAEEEMNIARAYQGNAMLSDGRVLTLGGSWNQANRCTGEEDGTGTCSEKTAEIWDEDTGWSVLSGIDASPISTNDVNGLYRSDNHMWLFSIPGGKVLHAGPAKRMNLLDVAGNGTITPSVLRANDADAMNGNATMYDIGKILTTGGAPNYENDDATASAFVIDASGTNVSARRVSSMAFQRAYHNSVVLPTGEVVIIGGQAYPIPFSDDQSVMTPELWNPATESFRDLEPMAVPRNYHSVAMLTQDGRVMAGGGGLCGACATNHFDIEIFTPPYLYNSSGNLAIRPTIESAPTAVTYGDQISVQTGAPVASIVLVRASAVTHSVNNAQRRVPLEFVRLDGNQNRAKIPTDAGSVIPGNYMLFVIDSDGVPSVGRTINISNNPSTQDTDGDGIIDSNDDFPFDPDNDIDGDLVSGHIDNCPVDSNADQSDLDGDGIGDACDPEDNRPSNEFSAQISNQRYDACMEIEGQSVLVGANVQTSNCISGADHQIFNFSIVSGFTDTYNIRASHSELCLAVSGGATGNGASIIQTSCANNDSQQFRVVDEGDAKAIYTGTGTGTKVVDASADLDANGVTRNVIQWNDLGNTNQRWIFDLQEEPVSDPSPQIQSPLVGSTLSGSSETFSWSSHPEATQYRLWLGSTAGGDDYGRLGNGDITSVTAPNMPVDGSDVYATLKWYDGKWNTGESIRYTTSVSDPSPQIQSPLVGSTLSGSSETFSWSSHPEATQYRLWLGSTAGGDDYGRLGNGDITSVTAPNMPVDGSDVYATLKWYDGKWNTGESIRYTTSVSDPSPQIQSPLVGSTLSGSSETFSWSSHPEATQYRLWLGSTAGGDDYGRLGNGDITSVTAPNMPVDGSDVYATLKWYDGKWNTGESIRYTTSVSDPSPQIQSPLVGSTLSGSSETFSWSSHPEATQYRLWLGSTAGGDDYGRLGNGDITSVTAPNMPVDGSDVYATLKWYDGKWNTAPSVSYQAASGSSIFTNPVSGTVISGGVADFQWNAILGATRYRVWVGSIPGGDDYGRFVSSSGTNRLIVDLPMDGAIIYVTLKWYDGSWHTEPSQGYVTGP